MTDLRQHAYSSYIANKTVVIVDIYLIAIFESKKKYCLIYTL
jgi:hypothetical protein